MPSIHLSASDPATLDVDALVVGAVSDDGVARLVRGHGLPRGATAHLKTALETVGAAGAAEEVTTFVAVPGVTAKRVLVAGLGAGTATHAPTDPEILRRAAGAAARGLRNNASIALSCPLPQPKPSLRSPRAHTQAGMRSAATPPRTPLSPTSARFTSSRPSPTLR